MAKAKIVTPDPKPRVHLRVSAMEAVALEAVLRKLPEDENSVLGNVGLQLHNVWDVLNDVLHEGLEDYQSPAVLDLLSTPGSLSQGEVSDEDVASSEE